MFEALRQMFGVTYSQVNVRATPPSHHRQPSLIPHLVCMKNKKREKRKWTNSNQPPPLQSRVSPPFCTIKEGRRHRTCSRRMISRRKSFRWSGISGGRRHVAFVFFGFTSSLVFISFHSDTIFNGGEHVSFVWEFIDNPPFCLVHFHSPPRYHPYAHSPPPQRKQHG